MLDNILVGFFNKTEFVFQDLEHSLRKMFSREIRTAKAFSIQILFSGPF